MHKIAVNAGADNNRVELVVCFHVPVLCVFSYLYSGSAWLCRCFSLKLLFDLTIREGENNPWDRGLWVPLFRKAERRLENGI